MQHGHPVAEDAAHAGHGLRRQRDLGDEEDGAVSSGDQAAQHLQVDERLPGSRDAMQQNRHVDWRLQNPLHGSQLVFGQ